MPQSAPGSTDSNHASDAPRRILFDLMEMVCRYLIAGAIDDATYDRQMAAITALMEVLPP
jgi:hypothetical protein